ncbi:YusW family protein [Lysinibacillus sp. KU-BSD001]|uniref:YusW family protein n=1 Tax=Lysinibacillus sp. KU-BSD001 TaxID=3141328 RepID=UPI0036E0B5E3
MHKIKWLVIPLSFLLLTACNKDNDEATNVPNDAPTQLEDETTAGGNGTNVTNTSAANAPFKFTHFSLDVDYSDTQSFEVEYENEESGVEASIGDDVSGEALNGNAAYDQLEPIFKSFTFDAATAEVDVIAEVMKAFELEDNYQKFELDIRFADGTEKEYHEQK